MAHIFLSHSHRDASIVEVFRETLQASGLRVWIDDTHLRPGTDVWQQEIERAMVQAACCVVILTPNAKDSEWVRHEIAYAKMLGLPVIAVHASGDPLDAIPLDLAASQRVDIRYEREQRIQRLAEFMKVEYHSSDVEQEESAAKRSAATQERLSPYSATWYGQAQKHDWPIVPFGKLVHRVSSRKAAIAARDRRPGPYPFYGAVGIQEYIDEYRLEGDRLLISRVGSHLLSRSSPIAFKASGKFSASSNAFICQPKPNVLLDYLVHFFASIDIAPQLGGGMRPYLSWDVVQELPITVPPLLEQERIVHMIDDQLDAAQQMRQALQAQLSALDELEIAMMRRTFIHTET